MGNMSTISFTTNYPHRSDVYDNGDNHLYAGVLYRQMEVFFFDRRTADCFALTDYQTNVIKGITPFSLFHARNTCVQLQDGEYLVPVWCALYMYKINFRWHL